MERVDESTIFQKILDFFSFLLYCVHAIAEERPRADLGSSTLTFRRRKSLGRDPDERLGRHSYGTDDQHQAQMLCESMHLNPNQGVRHEDRAGPTIDGGDMQIRLLEIDYRTSDRGRSSFYSWVHTYAVEVDGKLQEFVVRKHDSWIEGNRLRWSCEDVHTPEPRSGSVGNWRHTGKWRAERIRQGVEAAQKSSKFFPKRFCWFFPNDQAIKLIANRLDELSRGIVTPDDRWKATCRQRVLKGLREANWKDLAVVVGGTFSGQLARSSRGTIPRLKDELVRLGFVSAEEVERLAPKPTKAA